MAAWRTHWWTVVGVMALLSSACGFGSIGVPRDSAASLRAETEISLADAEVGVPEIWYLEEPESGGYSSQRLAVVTEGGRVIVGGAAGFEARSFQVFGLHPSLKHQWHATVPFSFGNTSLASGSEGPLVLVRRAEPAESRATCSLTLLDAATGEVRASWESPATQMSERSLSFGVLDGCGFAVSSAGDAVAVWQAAKGQAGRPTLAVSSFDGGLSPHGERSWRLEADGEAGYFGGVWPTAGGRVFAAAITPDELRVRLLEDGDGGRTQALPLPPRGADGALGQAQLLGQVTPDDELVIAAVGDTTVDQDRPIPVILSKFSASNDSVVWSTRATIPRASDVPGDGVIRVHGLLPAPDGGWLLPLQRAGTGSTWRTTRQFNATAGGGTTTSSRQVFVTESGPVTVLRFGPDGTLLWRKHADVAGHTTSSFSRIWEMLADIAVVGDDRLVFISFDYSDGGLRLRTMRLSDGEDLGEEPLVDFSAATGYTRAYTRMMGDGTILTSGANLSGLKLFRLELKSSQ